MIGTLLVKERVEPALLDMFRTAIIGPRIAVASSVIKRGIDRGELRSDLDPDVVVRMIVGALFVRHLAGLDGDAAWLDTVFDTLWRGIAAP